MGWCLVFWLSTVVLGVVGSTDTVLYCVWRSLWDGVLYFGYPLWCWVLWVALTSLVYGDHNLSICCHCIDDGLRVGRNVLFH